MRYQQAIKCGTTAIVAGNIIVGTGGVYQHLKSGAAFDITYPILYAGSAIAASATGNGNYLMYSFTITTTQSLTLTAYKPIFIKGNLSGTTFTPVNTAPLTQTIPTSADGYEYILLGVAYSTTAMYLLSEHPIFAYKGGAFGQISSKGITDLSISGKTITYTRGDGTTGTITTQDTTYSAATTSATGLMSATDKTKLNATNIAYGTCPTAAATAAKVITISGNTNWALAAGSIIVVKFTYTNTASNPTFNVNGTGAKSVLYDTAVIATSNLSYAGYANRYGIYTYDGTRYVFLGWSYDANSTYSNASLGQGYGTCTTAEATTAKVVSLSSYALVTGGVVAVKFTNAVPANATMNINSKGAKAIYYKNAAIPANIIKAGNTATFIYDGTRYQLLGIDDLESGNLTIDLTDSEAGIVPTTNSDQLGGIPANKYALKTDVAPDSNKLGGKAPEYYVQPRNLLDNSDFTNPVNQRGRASYSGYCYSLDRWTLNPLNEGSCSLSISSGYITLGDNSYIQQRFPIGLYDEGKTYTCAIWYTDGEISVFTGALIGQAYNFNYFNVVPETNRGIKYIALYEGTYTAETLPPYVPKGYAAELAECRRYCRKFSGIVLFPYYASSSIRYYRLMLDPPMRTGANPSVSDITGGEQPLNSWTGTNATFALVRTLPTDITLSATANSSASNFMLSANMIVSSDL